MSKRILIFSLAYFPKFVGGAEVAIKEITDRIPTEEFQFDMITLRLDKMLPRLEKIGNVNVRRIGFSIKNPTPTQLVSFPLYLMKVLYPLLAFIEAVRIHRKNPYHGVWAMMSYMGFPAIFLKFFFKNMGLLVTLQEGDTIEHITKRFRIRIVYFFYRKIFLSANYIQPISTYLAKFAKNMGAMCPIEVIPNGVDVGRFKVQDLKFKNEEIRKSLGIKRSDKVIITTSRLVEKNGIEDIVASLSYLSEDTKLLILGTGPLKEKLKSRVENLNLKNRVFFLGHMEHHELPAYLNASDIFVRPSLSEGQGISFIEAMAAGIPVVATPVGGIPDFLRDGETGVFCEVKNPKSIALKINFLFDHRDIRDRIIKNSREMVEKMYDWNLIADKMEHIFSKL